MLVHQLFERRVALQPDRIALLSGTDSITYQELNNRANQMADLLMSVGVSAQSRVAVCLDRGFSTIVSLLGVLKAGGTCVPIDAEYPQERRELMASIAEITHVVAQRGVADAFRKGSTQPILVDADAYRSAGLSSANLSNTADELGLAYILFTSGSTGIPKGVEIEHHALSDNATKTSQLLGLTEHDRMLQFASISFASSMGQIFAPLASGACLVIRGRQYSAEQIIQCVHDNEVTVLWLTPSVIDYLTQRPELSIAHLSHPLRLVRSGGEALTHSLVQRWFEHSAVPLLNVYGPTEAVQDITACEYRAAPEQVAIGKPLFDTEVLVLDESGEPVPAGADGELYFTTPGMARGYVNQPQLTSERFVWRKVNGQEKRFYRSGDMVRLRDDGLLEYRGRRDGQVKVHGYRVELGEVEAHLATHPAVAAAAVVLSTSGPGDSSLTAYYVPDDAAEGAEPNLLRWCSQALPMHIVPLRYVRVPRLPLTANGKLDRQALKVHNG